jgi:hypothetical protein
LLQIHPIIPCVLHPLSWHTSAVLEMIAVISQLETSRNPKFQIAPHDWML